MGPKRNSPTISAEEAQEKLRSVNWDAYWGRVSRRVDKRATAFERARAKSFESAKDHVLL